MKKPFTSQIISGCLLSTLLLPSCATMFSGSRQSIRLVGTPAGSTYFINDKAVEATAVNGKPNTVKILVPRKRNAEVKVKHEGYKDYIQTLYPDNVTGLSYLNYFPLAAAIASVNTVVDSSTDSAVRGVSYLVMVAGFGSFIVDRITGAGNQLDKKELQVTMSPVPKAVAGSQSIQCTQLNVRFKAGDKMGSVYIQGESKETLTFGKSLDTNAENLIKTVNSSLKDIGYSVPDTEAKSLFAAGHNTRFVLQGEMRDIKYDVHASSPYSSAHFETRCTVEVTWKLLTQNRQTVLEQKTAGSSVKFEQGGVAVFEDAFENSLFTFLANPRTAEILAKPASSNDLSTLQTPIQIKRGTTFAADKGLTMASRSVVVVETPDGHGSGCIISPDGYIVTNAHVVGDEQELSIKLADGMTSKAKLVRLNSEKDLALLKLDAEGLTAFSVPTTNLAEIGADVFAIGTPADKELGQTVTKGIISAQRKVDGHSFIQTDVSINGGNSGGALVTRSGQLLGIVNAKLIGRGIEGIGFAIPADQITQGLNLKFIN